MKWYAPIVFLILGATHVQMVGQSEPPMPITRIQDVQFDGKVDEPAWDVIAPLPMVQYEPMAGAPPTEQTEIRLAYDDKYFYVSMRAFDRDPNGIRATSLYRDQIAGSDHLEILLDTYNDNQTGYIFTTTPTGIRNDADVANDATVSTVLQGRFFNRDLTLSGMPRARRTNRVGLQKCESLSRACASRK